MCNCVSELNIITIESIDWNDDIIVAFANTILIIKKVKLKTDWKYYSLHFSPFLEEFPDLIAR